MAKKTEPRRRPEKSTIRIREEIYRVRLEALTNLWCTTGFLKKSRITEDPGPPPAAEKIHNQTRLLLLVLLLLSPHGKVGSAGNEMYGVPLK